MSRSNSSVRGTIRGNRSTPSISTDSNMDTPNASSSSTFDMFENSSSTIDFRKKLKKGLKMNESNAKKQSKRINPNDTSDTMSIYGGKKRRSRRMKKSKKSKKTKSRRVNKSRRMKMYRGG